MLLPNQCGAQFGGFFGVTFFFVALIAPCTFLQTSAFAPDVDAALINLKKVWSVCGEGCHAPRSLSVSRFLGSMWVFCVVEACSPVLFRSLQMLSAAHAFTSVQLVQVTENFT